MRLAWISCIAAWKGSVENRSADSAEDAGLSAAMEIKAELTDNPAICCGRLVGEFVWTILYAAWNEVLLIAGRAEKAVLRC